ncbi:MAG TPA: hypothetical protein VHB97_19570 [Polyangia bacterium]|jgi:hypothetical protein|nr:hypothetical protein [Polyangia bacterium]
MSRGYQLSAIGFQLGLCLLAAPCFGETPDGGATVSVVVEPNGDTTLDVKRGQLKVKAGGAEARVGTGESIRTQKGKPMRRVLAAATQTAPVADATLNATDVELAWQKVPGASRYVLEIAASPELSAAKTHTIDGTKTVVHLDTGTWYWRVVALDGSGAPGKRTAARRLTIDTTPPKLKTGKPEWK